MKSSLLPPNYHHMSEVVIGAVVQRSRPVSNALTSAVGGRFEAEDNQERNYRHVNTTLPRASKFEGALKIRDGDSSSVSQLVTRYLTPNNQATSASQQRSALPTVYSTRGKVIYSDASKMDKAVLHRQRRRLVQIRYRSKVRAKNATLERDVNLLREEVEKLAVQCQTLAPSVPANLTRWKVVAEYLRLFGRGLKAYAPPLAHVLPSVGCDRHRNFLQTSMVSDVRIDTGYGVEPMLMLWEKTSRMYGDFAIQLVRLDNGAGNSIVATYKVALTISENLLRYAFPHLLTSRGMSLKEKLIGQQLEMTGVSTFIWDDEQEQVSSALYSIDMLTPLHRLLGNVEELSRVFDNALVTPDCRLISAVY